MARQSELFLRALRAAQKCCYDSSKGSDKEAVSHWFRESWPSWYRDRWVEHLNGRRQWAEFPLEDFNLANADSLSADHLLATRIVEHLQRHRDNISENLGIILEAEKEKRDIKEVLKILRRLKINENRPEYDEDRVKVFYLALEEADRVKWIESQKAGRDLGEDCIAKWFEECWPDFAEKHGLSRDSKPSLC